MRKLGSEVSLLSMRLGNADPNARVARRAAEVQAMFKEAIEHIYKENAGYVLDHVNAVYIKREQRPGSEDENDCYKALYIYMDDGNFRSDVHSQQHFILLWLKEKHGEDIEVFKTYPSRMGMKDRHPYAEAAAEMKESKARTRSIPLDEEEMAETCAQGERIENERLRDAFMKAAVVDKEWKKGEREFL